MKIIIDSIKEYLIARENRKALEIQRKIALDNKTYELRMERAKLEADYASKGKVLPDNLDRISIEQMDNSYKDEIIMTILFSPLVMVFIPSLAPVVETGFKILQTSMPDWYMYLVVGIVVVTFGLRGMIKFLVSKRKIF